MESCQIGLLTFSFFNTITQPEFTCSKLTIEILEQSVKKNKVWKMFKVNYKDTRTTPVFLLLTSRSKCQLGNAFITLQSLNKSYKTIAKLFLKTLELISIFSVPDCKNLEWKWYKYVVITNVPSFYREQNGTRCYYLYSLTLLGLVGIYLFGN